MTDTHIKIKPVVPKVQYTGNGSTTVFPYNFAIFSDSDMVVYVDDEIVESGYTVSGAGQTDGGNVTFSTAPADGVNITLLRQVSIERITDFQEGGTFRPKNINDELDRQTAFAQQLSEEVSRSVKVGPTISGADLTLESITPNRALKWNEDGDGIISTTYDPDEMVGLSISSAESAQASAQAAATDAQSAKWYAENIVFGMAKEIIRSTDWQQDSGKYKIFVADKSIIDGVYKKNANDKYELVKNIDLVVSDSGVTIISQSAFDGFYCLPDSTKTTYTYTQVSPLDTWVIEHNLGKKPVVVLVDDTDTVIVGTIKYDSLNQLTVTFTEAVSGKAYLN